MKDPFLLARQLIRLRKGELSGSEQAEIEQLLSTNRALAELNAELDNQKIIQRELQLIETFDVERAMARIRTKRNRRIRRRVVIWSAASVAAAILVFAGVSRFVGSAGPMEENHLYTAEGMEVTVPTLITTRGQDHVLSREALEANSTGEVFAQSPDAAPDLPAAAKDSIIYNTVVIPAGFTWKVQLSDGSVVTLDAGSELRFPEKFSANKREVEFVGKGYFHVAKSDVPFVVKAGEANLTVYGTSFNLLYSNRLSVAEAVLVEGSIGMKTGGGEEVRITPNQRICYALGEGTPLVEQVDPADYTGWMGKSFKYKAARLDRIAYDISRWYGVDIRINPRMNEDTYSMEFDKTCSLEWVIGALEKIVKQEIKRKDGAYIIE